MYVYIINVKIVLLRVKTFKPNISVVTPEVRKLIYAIVYS